MIIDIQHFYAEGNDNDNFNALFDYIRNIKGNNGTNLLDYVHYDSSIDQLKDLKYGKVVSNKSSAGVVIFAKTHNFNEIYYRDGDAHYENTNYENVYSLWHEQNKSSTMIECIENEFRFLLGNPRAVTTDTENGLAVFFGEPAVDPGLPVLDSIGHQVADDAVNGILVALHMDGRIRDVDRRPS